MNLMHPRDLKIANWLMLAALVAIGLAWQGWEFALGVLAGGLLVVVNFHILHHTLKGILEQMGPDPREVQGRAKAFFAARQMLRFFGLLAIVYLLVRHGWVNIFGFLVGLSTVVLTLMLAAIIEVIKLKNKEANPSHGTPHSVS